MTQPQHIRLPHDITSTYRFIQKLYRFLYSDLHYISTRNLPRRQNKYVQIVMLIHMSRRRHGQTQKSFTDNVIPLSNKHGYHNSLLHATLHNNRTKDSHPALRSRACYLARVGEPQPTQNNPYDRALTFRYNT